MHGYCKEDERVGMADVFNPDLPGWKAGPAVVIRSAGRACARRVGGEASDTAWSHRKDIGPQFQRVSKSWGSIKLPRPSLAISRSPHSAIVVSSSLRITSRAVVTPASPLAPRP